MPVTTTIMANVLLITVPLTPGAADRLAKPVWNTPTKDIVWCDPDIEVQEWARLEREAFSVEELQEIAAYLLSSGQASA
jgi:hypothetical protein